METLNILLCCGAGMSSGFLAQKTRKAAKNAGFPGQSMLGVKVKWLRT